MCVLEGVMTEEVSADKVRGVVKWYNPAKGYGFIQLPGGGVDIFVHANQLEKAGISHLKEGADVQFLTSKGPKGSYATDISLVSATKTE